MLWTLVGSELGILDGNVVAMVLGDELEIKLGVSEESNEVISK